MGKRHLFSLVALLSLSNCSPPRSYKNTDWDLVVVVLDALPAGHLGLFGYRPTGSQSTPISPNIDAFAKGTGSHQVLTFEAAFSTASYTLASTASLFTGMNPAAHGVLGHSSNVLSKEHLTLAEAFNNAGFATAALSANPNISSEGQFDQGFETFRHYFRDEFSEHSLPATMLPDAGTWWQNNADRQRLLYAHLLPPHQPYDPPAPHAGLFGSKDVPRKEGLTPYLVELGKRSDLTPKSPEIQRIQRRFDAGVHYADALFGELLQTLSGTDGRGLDKTVIVLTSDHGEAFAEHGLILHGGGVNAELCQVPLMIAFPGDQLSDQRRYEHVVSTGDLAPTLCELFDLPWPGAAKGSSFLQSAMHGEPTGRPAISRSVGEHPVWSLRTETSTLIEHRATQTALRFDRRRDPKELLNLAGEDPQILKDLTSILRAQLRAAQKISSAFPRGRTPELIHKDALEQLGYFGD